MDNVTFGCELAKIKFGGITEEEILARRELEIRKLENQIEEQIQDATTYFSAEQADEYINDPNGPVMYLKKLIASYDTPMEWIPRTVTNILCERFDDFMAAKTEESAALKEACRNLREENKEACKKAGAGWLWESDHAAAAEETASEVVDGSILSNLILFERFKIFAEKKGGEVT